MTCIELYRKSYKISEAEGRTPLVHLSDIFRLIIIQKAVRSKRSFIIKPVCARCAIRQYTSLVKSVQHLTYACVSFVMASVFRRVL